MQTFKINDKVKINDKNIYGKIVSINNAKVVFKTPDSKVIITDISKIEKYEYTDVAPRINLKYPEKRSNETSSEIMLRHLTKEEAIQKLEKFLSDSLINKEYKVRIIHGKHRWYFKKCCS